MRDLSGFNSSYNGRVANRRKRIFTSAIILIVLVGVFLIVKSRISWGGSNSASVLLREAPRGLKPVDFDNQSINVEGGGADLTSQSLTLRDVKYGGEAKATANRSFGGGIYILSVDATLPDPKNTYYQVWLVGANGPLSIDYMRGSKTSWSLNLRDKDKYSKYSGILITLERTKDEIPEEHVMEGSF